MVKKRKTKNNKLLGKFGFTMVELVIVIVVIAILTAAAFLAYSQWKRSTVATVLKSDLNNVAAAMEDSRTFGNTYPATFPSSFSPSSGVTITGGSDDGKTYCFEAVNSQFPDLTYYIDSSSNQPPKEGVCPIKIITVSVGGNSTCSIASDNNLYCWGGEITGNSPAGVKKIPTVVSMSGALTGKTVKAISVGKYNRHACVIASDDKAYCWGGNDYGQLGDGTTTSSATPVAVNTSGVLSGKTIKYIESGIYATCAIASDNQTYCWGNGSSGQLGNGGTANSSVPVAVSTSGVLNGKTIKSLSTGLSYSCVVASDNQAYCWGNNVYGQLGNAVSGDWSSAPVAVSTSGVIGGKTILSLAVGMSGDTCAVASDSKVYCWGRNNVGQLGDGTTVDKSSPVAVNTAGVLNGKNIKYVSTGCVVASDNLPYCWGYNSGGRLGDGTTTNSSVPVAVNTSGVLNGKIIKKVFSTGSIYHVCAIANDSQLYCWGSNSSGQLGNNTYVSSSVPVATSLLSN